MNAPLILAGLFALAYLGLVARPESLIRSIVKTASVALLALAAALAGGPILLVAALALCALGDWLLSRPGEGAFMAGIGAFAAGHLAYVAAFLTHPLADLGRLTAMPQPAIIVAMAVLGLGAARLLAPRAGALRGPVLGYIPVIVSMALAALVLPPVGALAWLLPAALLFVFSDLVLAGETFLLPEGHRARAATPYIVWASYWGAQLGFTLILA